METAVIKLDRVIDELPEGVAHVMLNQRVYEIVSLNGEYMEIKPEGEDSAWCYYEGFIETLAKTKS